MNRIKHVIRNTMLYLAVFGLVFGAPTVVRAEDSEEPPEVFNYDTDSNKWNSNKWTWDATQNAYVPTPTPAPQPAPEPQAETPQSVSEQQAEATQLGSASNNAIDSQGTSTNTQNVGTTVDMHNGVDSKATTGSATVSKNYQAGSASSGTAHADTTIVNTVHSTVQGESAGVARFTADINGNVNGDITLYPANANATVNGSQTNNSNINVDNKSAITNDITLSAASGDATVDSNTKAGSATTGDADTVANVINLINSIISANKSFIGTINIYGNLNGDILISPEFIPQLIASNGGSYDSKTENNLTANLDNNQSIINNIKLSAETGDATVDGNTSAGSAKTGNAQTNLTVLNLTGRSVIAKNSILVFVNVLGKWVGIIADAPAGATAAALGSGVTTNQVTNNTNINAKNSSSITNNLNLSSLTGDATVRSNTEAGDATTGNATASANILNIDMSTFDISDWFGILFINVFGEWYGSFGVDTENGNVVPLGNMAMPAPAPTDQPAPTVRFGFVPRAAPSSSTVATTPLPLGEATNSALNEATNQAQAVLAAAKVPAGGDTPHFASVAPRSSTPLPFLVTVGVMVAVPLLGLAVLIRRWLGF